MNRRLPIPCASTPRARWSPRPWLLAAVLLVPIAGLADDATRKTAAAWRAEHRLIDLHQHVDSSETALRRDMRLMDTVGVGLVVNLSGGFVTHKPGEKSAF